MQNNYWHCSHSIWSRADETVGHLSVSLSIPSFARLLLWHICCWAPCQQEISINSGKCWMNHILRHTVFSHWLFSIIWSGAVWQAISYLLLVISRKNVSIAPFLRYCFHSVQDCKKLLVKKVKVAHVRLPSVGFQSWSRFLAVSLQMMWLINPDAITFRQARSYPRNC